MTTTPDPTASLDHVIDEFADRHNRGERPSVDEYLARYPHLAADLAGVLPLLAALAPTATYQPAVHAATDDTLPAVPGFTLLRELGRGGMGVVYLARQEKLNRLVALKAILASKHAAPDTRARFLAEAEAAARLTHPGVVQVFELGTYDGQPYQALEYLPGGLDRQLGGVPLPTTEAARLVTQIARAVAAAHAVGIVHRDLKPANVLFAADGTPKVTDFGLAKLAEADAGLTASGAIMGTPSYMAPEQAGGAKAVGPAADVYAVGAILYECLTGRPPFKGASLFDTLEQVRGREPVPVRALQPAVPRDLETVCLKCLQKDPAKRYPSAEALADDLDRFLSGRPVAARPVGTLSRTWRWARRNPAVAGLLTGIAVLLFGVTVASVLAAVQFRESQLRAEGAEGRERDKRIEADDAKRDAEQKLFEARLSEGRATRLAGGAGSRDRALAALREAAAIGRKLGLPAEAFADIRTEAAGCLLLDDVRELPGEIAWPTEGLTFNGDLTRAVRADAAAVAKGSAEVISVPDGAVVARLTAPPGLLTSRVLRFFYRFSPDGRWLAGTLPQTTKDNRLVVWDLARQAVAWTTRVSAPWLWAEPPVDFLPDGRVVFVDPDNRLVAVDPTTGRVERLTDPVSNVSSFAVSPDGRRVAVLRASLNPGVAADPTGAWGQVIAFGAPAAEPTQVRAMNGGPVTWHPRAPFVGYGNDEVQLAPARGGPVRLWSTKGTARQAPRTRFTPDGGRVWVVSPESGTDLCETWSGRPVLALPPGVGVNSAGTKVVVRRGSAATVWEFTASPVQRPLPTDDDPDGPFGVLDKALAAGPDARAVFAVAHGRLWCWDLARAELVRGIDLWPTGKVPQAGFPRAVLGPDGLHIAYLDRVIRRAFAATPTGYRLDTPVTVVPTAGAVLDPQGSGAVVSEGKSPKPTLTAIPFGPNTAPNTVGGSFSPRVAVSRDGRWAVNPADGYSGSDWAVWQAGTRPTSPTARLRNATTAVLGRPAFSPDSRLLVLPTPHSYRLWRVGEWAAEAEVVAATGGSESVAFSASGLFALATQADAIELRTTTDLQVVARLPLPAGTSVGSMALTPDGTVLVYENGRRSAFTIDLRELRRLLLEFGPDWDLPPYPPAPAEPPPPLRLEVVGEPPPDPPAPKK